MALTANIPTDLLVPGDTVRLEFEILTTDQGQVDQMIHQLKQDLANDPRFDYQGSQLSTVGDLKLKRDVKLLSVFVTVRKSMRESREPIEYASLSMLEAYAMAAAEVWWQAVDYLGPKIEKGVIGILDAAPKIGLAALVIAGLLAYVFIFGVPQKS